MYSMSVSTDSDETKELYDNNSTNLNTSILFTHLVHKKAVNFNRIVITHVTKFTN